MEKTTRYIMKWMRKYLRKSGCDGFVVGVSGGIDSAVTSTLCGLTQKPTLALGMPIHSDRKSMVYSAGHLRRLELDFPEVRSNMIELSDAFDSFKDAMGEDPDDFALANARARLRMTTLYYHAQKNNYLVVGTGNKVEDFGVGFFTKYGDGGVDISPIAVLLKSEVYALGEFFNIDARIMEAEPTDGLHNDGRTDEMQMGTSYELLEYAMKWNGDPRGMTKEQADAVEIYNKLNAKNQHKMNPIPVCEIPLDVKEKDGYG